MSPIRSYYHTSLVLILFDNLDLLSDEIIIMTGSFRPVKIAAGIKPGPSVYHATALSIPPFFSSPLEVVSHSRVGTVQAVLTCVDCQLNTR